MGNPSSKEDIVEQGMNVIVHDDTQQTLNTNQIGISSNSASDSNSHTENNDNHTTGSSSPVMVETLINECFFDVVNDDEDDDDEEEEDDNRRMEEKDNNKNNNNNKEKDLVVIQATTPAPTSTSTTSPSVVFTPTTTVYLGNIYETIDESFIIEEDDVEEEEETKNNSKNEKDHHDYHDDKPAMVTDIHKNTNTNTRTKIKSILQYIQVLLLRTTKYNQKIKPGEKIGVLSSESSSQSLLFLLSSFIKNNIRIIQSIVASSSSERLLRITTTNNNRRENENQKNESNTKSSSLLSSWIKRIQQQLYCNSGTNTSINSLSMMIASTILLVCGCGVIRYEYQLQKKLTNPPHVYGQLNDVTTPIHDIYQRMIQYHHQYQDHQEQEQKQFQEHHQPIHSGRPSSSSSPSSVPAGTKVTSTTSKSDPIITISIPTQSPSNQQQQQQQQQQKEPRSSNSQHSNGTISTSTNSNHGSGGCNSKKSIVHRSITPRLLVGTRGSLSSTMAYLRSGPPKTVHHIQHREILTMPYDGATIALDWELPPLPSISSSSSSNSNTTEPSSQEEKQKRIDEILHGPIEQPIVLILHGINNDTSFGYMRDLMRTCSDHGWIACGMNFRGCGNVPLTTPRGYTGGYTGDLRGTIQIIESRLAKAVTVTTSDKTTISSNEKDETDHNNNHSKNHTTTPKRKVPIILVGHSLGANIITKYLGEECYSLSLPSCVAGGISMGNPMSLNATRMNKFWSSIITMGTKYGVYQNYRYFLPMIRSTEQYRTIFRQIFWGKVLTLEDFDRTVSPLYVRNDPTYPFRMSNRGYENGEEYWEDISSSRVVPFIQVPLLQLVALDDFLIHKSHTRCMDQNIRNPYVLVIATHCGGHLGWQEEEEENEEIENEQENIVEENVQQQQVNPTQLRNLTTTINSSTTIPKIKTKTIMVEEENVVSPPPTIPTNNNNNNNKRSSRGTWSNAAVAEFIHAVVDSYNEKLYNHPNNNNNNNHITKEDHHHDKKERRRKTTVIVGGLRSRL